MQHNVIFVGSLFRKNQIFYEYIKRELLKSLGNIDNIHFFNDQDKALFLSLESFIQQSQKLVIICSKSNFSVMGRLLCTISEDSQIVKDEMLIPSNTDVYAKNSYLLNVHDTNVNVMQAEPTKAFPEILFEDPTPQAVLHIFDENEHDLKLLLTPLAESFDISFDVNEWIDLWLVVEISALKYGELTGFIHAATALLKGKVIASSNIMAYIIDKLQKDQKKITTAESCTGGLIATLITSQSGSSAVFDGGIVTYSNEKKNQWLGVDEEILIKHGAVSKETVLAMSQGAKDVAEADYALSISGIAGPSGGSAEKPVGLVYISICTKNVHIASMLQLFGDRNYIQHQAAYHAIKMLLLSDKELFFNLS
jgi:nicotinamide-nucleotide amidase